MQDARAGPARPDHEGSQLWGLCIEGYQLEWGRVPGEISMATVWQVEEAGEVGESGERMGTRLVAPEQPCPTGVWPQFRTIQEKEVTILNNKECDDFYHRFSKIPSVVQIINSKMICAKDFSREEFCYVSTPPGFLTSRAPGQDGEGHGEGPEGCRVGQGRWEGIIRDGLGAWDRRWDERGRGQEWAWRLEVQRGGERWTVGAREWR